MFGSICRRKKRVERRLQGVQQELELRDTESILRLEKALRKDNEILLQEELLWFLEVS